MAGSLAVAITYPFDIIRARVAYELSHVPNSQQGQGLISSAIKRLQSEGKLYRSHSLLGLYQGFLPTLLGIIPYAGTSFFTFECSKIFLKRQLHREQLNSAQTFVAGLFAGACGQTVAYPLDVLRRRMQLFRITNHLPEQHYNAGIIHAIKSIFQAHGLARGIFAGLSINYIKVAPASGISFMIYEKLKHTYPNGPINREV